MNGWTTGKRILAVAVAIFAIVGVLLVAGALVGSWIVNDQVTDLTLNLLDRVDTGIDRVDTVVTQVDEQFEGLNNTVQAVEIAVMTLGGTLEENRIVINLISDLLGVELGVRAQRAGQAIGSIQSAAETIDGTLQTIDALPFVSVLDNRPNLEVFGTIAQGLEGFQNDVADTRAVVDERRSEIIEGGVSIVTERTSRLSSRIDNVQGMLRDVTSQLEALRQRIQETRESFPGTLDLLTLVLNLLLLLVALAFLSLFAHSVSLFKRPEQSFGELAGWSGSAEDEEAVEVLPEGDQETD